MASAEGQEPVERDLLCWDMVVCLPVSGSARSHAIHSEISYREVTSSFLWREAILVIFLLLHSECLQFGMPILAMLYVSVHMPYKSIEAYEEENEDICLAWTCKYWCNTYMAIYDIY
jgi:hypothetical protein